MSVQTLGNYELEGLLGEGGIGQVYAAQDKVLGRRVAIKTLRQELSRNRSFVDRFYSEAKSLANLNHTNITTLYALHVEGSEAFMVMELVHGQTLEALLNRVGRLTLGDSLAILAQAIPGIRYAHRRGVIHRDLKPANLMLTDDGIVKIMDFGIARVRGSEHLTRVGEFCGTFVYASPEQIRGEDVDERSDLYSLAIVLYRMLSGSPPFQSDNEYALMTAQLQTPPPPLTGRVPGLDAATEAALMRALAKRREDRYPSVEEFGRALGAMALRGESVDILQQLYQHAFTSDDPEATRIITTRHAPAVDPVPPPSPPRHTADWQLPSALAASDPVPLRPEAGRHPILAAAPARAAAPPPQETGRGALWRWPAIGALAMLLLLAGGYFVVSPGLSPLSFFSKPAPGIADAPSAPEPQIGSPSPATPAEPTKPAAAAPPPAPATAAEEEPPPSPPPAPVTAAKEEPSSSPPPAPVTAAKEEPPPSPPPAPVTAAKEEPPPSPPPAPVTAAKEEPSSSPPPAPVTAAKEEPPPSPPPAPVTAAKEEPLPSPPPAPPTAAKEEPPPSPPPAPVTVAKEEPLPSPPPAPVTAATEEPPPLPSLAPMTAAKEEPPSSPAAPAVPQPKPPPSAATTPGRLASLEPGHGPAEPEGKPDLQGPVTGAKRLDEIEVAARWIRIYGIVDPARGGQEAQHVQALVRYLKPSHNHIVCYHKVAGTYRCYSDGQDIARLALEDGMVHPAPNAPPEYRVLPTARH